MSQHIPSNAPQAGATSLRPACPPWCVAPHGFQEGEEDWVHLSEPTMLTGRLPARLCMSVDPRSDARDGPYVLVGSEVYTPAQIHEAATTLLALADDAVATSRREAV